MTLVSRMSRIVLLIVGFLLAIARCGIATEREIVTENVSARGARIAGEAILAEQSYKNATKLWLEAADLGNETAQYVVGVMHTWGLNGLEKDETKAVLNYYFSALGGYVPAQMALGYRHFRGDGVPSRCRTAVTYLELAANTMIDKLNAQGGVEPGFIAERLQAADDPKPDVKSFADVDVVDYYHNLASKGDSQAIGTLGRIYYFGARGVDRDLVRAHQLLSVAASKGDVNAMTSLGHILLLGVPPTIPMDPQNAWKNFSAAAAGGNAAAYNGLGYMTLLGYPGIVEQDITEAHRHFTKAADAGVVEALYNLGAIYASSLRPQSRDFPKAVRYFGLAAQKGSILGLHKLAHMTLNGIGTMRSCKTAAQYFKTVAERALFATDSQVWFSEAYASFRVAPLAHTLERYLRLAEMGYEAAESNAARLVDEITSKTYTVSQRNTFLGQLHLALDHLGVSHPPLEGSADALRLYERAADQGNTRARVRVGDYYFFGQGDVGEPDLIEAAAHYRLASEGKDAQANFNLGYQHHYGLGLAEDPHLAKRYYDLASESSLDSRIAVSLAQGVLWFETAQKAFASGDKFITEDPAVAGWVDWWQTPSRILPSASSLELGEDTLLIFFLIVVLVGIAHYREQRNMQRRRLREAAARQRETENNNVT